MWPCLRNEKGAYQQSSDHINYIFRCHMSLFLLRRLLSFDDFLFDYVCRALFSQETLSPAEVNHHLVSRGIVYTHQTLAHLPVRIVTCADLR